MAKNASHADGNRGGKRVTREVGQRGNTRPRDDRSVRRAREVESSARLKRAKAEQQEAERRLAALDAELASQPHTPYRPPVDQQMVAEYVERTTGPPPKPRPRPSRELVSALQLLDQGYHVDRVATRTGLPVEALRSFVAKDGYVG